MPRVRSARPVGVARAFAMIFYISACVFGALCVLVLVTKFTSGSVTGYLIGLVFGAAAVASIMTARLLNPDRTPR